MDDRETSVTFTIEYVLVCIHQPNMADIQYIYTHILYTHAHIYIYKYKKKYTYIYSMYVYIDTYIHMYI